MLSAGFYYINNGDTVRCDACGLEVSGWTLDMKPFTIHAQRSPTCDFVRSILPDQIMSVSSTMNLLSTTSASTDDEKPSKRQKIEATQQISEPCRLVEIDTLKQIRKRTFSHWPHRTSPSSAQMIEAGFFGCNVGDRVICLYCNCIFQQWTPHTDDPCEVHKTLSPKCPYVIAMLKRQPTGSILIINEFSNNSHSLTSNNTDAFRCNEIVYTAACHTNYIEIPRRHASFDTWPKENLPSVDDLVRAGFFYTGTKTIVTCFYCNGSLQNWGANDNPTIEHARWFPHCAYAKQLCGPELHRKIQESKRIQQERAKIKEPSKQLGITSNNMGRGSLNISDESTLSRFVAARLDLFIAQCLLNRMVKLSIIKRCYEDQLRIKHDDFTDDCDVLVACIILQKQIERIDGKKENIIVPSVAMNKIREAEQAAIRACEQGASSSTSVNTTVDTDVEMSTSSESIRNEVNKPELTIVDQQTKNQKSSAVDPASQSQTDDSSLSDRCVLCLTEEKRLACIPCGHLTTCVPCGHSLRSCPICRREIEAFVRIYL
ncbi:unnamed protein product [Rotaria sp. Silwood1]|nr:unnamed protein product [Rotaria sp. Silwood1]